IHAPISLDRCPTRATDMTPTDVPETCHRIPSPVPALRSVLRRRQPAGATGAPAVLYVHGATFPSALSVRYRFVTETDERSWADALCAAGFDVWALDFLGFGDSERWPAMAGPEIGRASWRERVCQSV